MRQVSSVLKSLGVLIAPRPSSAARPIIIQTAATTEGDPPDRRGAILSGMRTLGFDADSSLALLRLGGKGRPSRGRLKSCV